MFHSDEVIFEFNENKQFRLKKKEEKIKKIKNFFVNFKKETIFSLTISPFVSSATVKLQTFSCLLYHQHLADIKKINKRLKGNSFWISQHYRAILFI
jgi:hypothetical protein